MASKQKIRKKSRYSVAHRVTIASHTATFQRLQAQAQKALNDCDVFKALPLCERLFRDHPENVSVLRMLGALRCLQRRYGEGVELLERARALEPMDVSIRRLLIRACMDGGLVEKALAMSMEFMKYPLNEDELSLAFQMFCNVCDWSSAATLQYKVIGSIMAEQGKIPVSNELILALTGMGVVEPEDTFTLYQMAAMQASTHGPAAPKTLMPNQIKPFGRLKIAYLSANFWSHPVACFISHVIAAHNRERVDVYCYAHLAKRDYITDKVRLEADYFIDVTEMNDGDLACRIRADGIHVLVDLDGYTADSRLSTLAWSPAPVQISWLGNFNTTGMHAVDFYITDHYVEHEGGTRYVEQLLYMPEISLCYGMRPSCPRREDAPAVGNEYITFGSLASSNKMNPRDINAWCRILKQTPDAYMALKACWNCTITSDHILAEFARNDIDSERIIFLPTSNTYDEHVAQYNLIDIVLDTFPCTGSSSTCEALFMGVPVVTLAEKTHASRVSLSILKNIGFEASIAENVDEYVNKAVQLATDISGLTLLRKSLPLLFEDSIIGHPDHFVAQLEVLYTDACGQKGLDLSDLSNSGLLSSPGKLSTQILAMPNNVSIVVPASLDESVTYVLAEQGDWYEAEIRFLRRIVGLGMRVLDVQPGYGCYALSLAQLTGNTGAVLAIEDDVEKRACIEESARSNGFYWLTTGYGSDSTMHAFAKEGVDVFIASESSEFIIATVLQLLVECSPIIMMPAMQDVDMDGKLSCQMRKQGYTPYRLIPGLELLAPIPVGYTSNSWHRQVFFCRPEHVTSLHDEGRLVMHVLSSISLPGDDTPWVSMLHARDYASELLPLWEEQAYLRRSESDWLVFRSALNAYALAHDSSQSPDQRYAMLIAAVTILGGMSDLEHRPVRACVLARIQIELGAYDRALITLNTLKQTMDMEYHEQFVPDEPFLTLGEVYDASNFVNHIAEWVFAQVLIVSEILHMPTSMSSDGQSLNLLNWRLEELGFSDTVIERRRQLLLMRCGLQNPPELQVFLTRKPEGDCNPNFFWSGCVPLVPNPSWKIHTTLLCDKISPSIWRVIQAHCESDKSDETNQYLTLVVPKEEQYAQVFNYFHGHFIQPYEGDEKPDRMRISIQKNNSSIDTLMKKISSPYHQTQTVESERNNDLQEIIEPYGFLHPLAPLSDNKITIFVPTYNRCKLLQRTVESILAQTYTNFELLIMDNASNDGTEEYCRKLASTDKRICYHRNQENLGLFGNYVLAYSLIKTDLYACCPDDDFLFSEHFEHTVKFFSQHPELGMVFGQTFVGDVSGNTENPAIIPTNYMENSIVDPRQMMLDSVSGNQMCLSSILVRKAAVERMITYAEKYLDMNRQQVLIGEGDYFFNILMLACAPIGYVHIPCSYYSVHSSTDNDYNSYSAALLGGGWSLEVRLRTVRYLQQIYNRCCGEDMYMRRRLQVMGAEFRGFIQQAESAMTDEEKLACEDKLLEFKLIISKIEGYVNIEE